MATTTRGITYPTSSDNIAPLESHFSALASSVDTVMAKNISGVTAAFSAPLTVGGTTTQVVSFPTALGATPAVVASISSGSSAVSAYVVSLYSITASGFSAKITRIFGTDADTTLKLNWIAKAE
jgi:hypothetical protein